MSDLPWQVHGSVSAATLHTLAREVRMEHTKAHVCNALSAAEDLSSSVGSDGMR